MTTAPLDTQLIIDRLRAQVAGLRQVAGAAGYAAIKGLGDFPAPCAYVVLAQEKPEGEQPKPGHADRGGQVKIAQRLLVTFGVVMAVRNYREQRGNQVADELATFLGQSRKALLGYVPDAPGARPCQFVRGDLTDYDAGTVLWTDYWQTHRLMTTEANP